MSEVVEHPASHEISVALSALSHLIVHFAGSNDELAYKLSEAFAALRREYVGY